ncbi:TetR/AcrR family transcriptional regulator [Nocardiopsis metallicus]|uniref:AcrR family transcriptional regulator n=1 Tax=Nocardiopsis metallicus TaxID=179819 RepID=A0A840WAE9_9ACTN|nr:TetR/AcrR family transcriptional regulator [Nocardiopsis metallicus]MBB5492363.1 AcrR family transcriptional regulator [Nocardiopsis metallicus]
MQTGNNTTGRKRASFIEQARREQVIRAAAETVAQVGYANASLSRIAEQAGISKSVISYHFAGKDELMVLVAQQFIDASAEFMFARVEAEPTATGQVSAWISGQVEYYAAHRTGFLAMISIITNHRSADGSNPFTGQLDEEVDEFARLLQRGQRDGEFRAFDPRSTAVIILRSTEALISAWVMDESLDLTDQMGTLLDFVHHAIRRENR